MTERPKLNQKVVVAVVYVSAMILNSLDSTIITVALSTLAREFDVSPASIESVVIGYLVSLAVFIPLSGWLGDRYGARRVFLVALIGFATASALCAVAASLGQLVLFRVLQGAAGGLMMPVGMAMLYRVFPQDERVRAARVLIVPTAAAPALGRILVGSRSPDIPGDTPSAPAFPALSAAPTAPTTATRHNRRTCPDR